jgi:uncharacterized protein
MVSEQDSNAALVTAGYAAFNSGNLDAVLELFGPDIEFRPLPDSPMGAVFKGHEGFRKMIAENNEMFDSYRNEPEEILEVGDDKVVVMVRSAARGRISGIEVDGRLAHLWTIAGGKATRCENYASREAAIQAATTGARGQTG